MLHYAKNAELLADLEEYVEGHTEAKKALITLVDRSKRRHHQKFILGMYPDFLLSPSKVLLIGASGTGKTHLVESLHKICHFPLVKVDATKLNPTGASGGIKERDLQDLIMDEAKRAVLNKGYSGAEYSSVEGAIDQTVVFIDEIDKLGRSFDSSGSWNAHVQSGFLTLFDNKAEFSGVSFIFAGAFTSLEDIQKTGKNGIGFNSIKEIVNSDCLDEDIVKAGLIPELVGRITAIVELDKFDTDDYLHILKSRLLPKKEMDMASMGVFDITLTDSQLYKMALRAYKSKQGVRSLQRELDKVFLDYEFNYEDMGSGIKYIDYNKEVL